MLVPLTVVLIFVTFAVGMTLASTATLKHGTAARHIDSLGVLEESTRHGGAERGNRQFLERGTARIL